MRRSPGRGDARHIAIPIIRVTNLPQIRQRLRRDAVRLVIAEPDGARERATVRLSPFEDNSCPEDVKWK